MSACTVFLTIANTGECLIKVWMQISEESTNSKVININLLKQWHHQMNENVNDLLQNCFLNRLNLNKKMLNI